MIHSLSRFRNISLGLVFFFLSISHIPSTVFPDFFDKSAPANVIVLLIISIFFCVYLLTMSRSLALGFLPPLGGILFVVIFLSGFLSGDFMSSVVGDATRFTGILSLVALAVVGCLHATLRSPSGVLEAYVFGVTAFQIVTLLDYFGLIDIPGTYGLSGSLGNLDFVSAYLGTAFPLYFYLWFKKGASRLHLFLGIPLTIYSIILAGAKQGYIDVILSVLISFLILFRRKMHFLVQLRAKSENFLAALLTGAALIWTQILLIVPFIGFHIPFVSDDLQVEIRGQYWSAAFNMFSDKPLLGVGPDLYGNYYEKYRGVDSVLVTERTLSNDAHSSAAQTLATLGLLGTLVFVLILFFLFKSWVLAMKMPDRDTKFLWIYIIYFFVYWTNSTISVITLPNKYLFWAMSGLVVGRVAAVSVSEKWRKTNQQLGIGILSGSLFFMGWVGINFSRDLLVYAQTFQRSVDDPKLVQTLAPSDYLPCLIYYSGLVKIHTNQPIEEQLVMAREQYRIKPRCGDALLNLLQYENFTKNYRAAEKYVRPIIDLMPTRREAIVEIIKYAEAVGDDELLRQAFLQAEKLGMTEKL